jgi:hypothetical protein
MYIPIIIITGSAIHTLIGGGDTHTDTQTQTQTQTHIPSQKSDLINLLLFFQNTETRLKMDLFFTSNSSLLKIHMTII